MSEIRQAALRALQQLAAATPEPPASDADPELILTRGGAVLAARERPLHDLAAALVRDPDALHGLAEAGELRRLIEQRAAGWHALLAHARHVVGERIVAVARLRRMTER